MADAKDISLDAALATVLSSWMAKNGTKGLSWWTALLGFTPNWLWQDWAD